jgi:hypothetical protein
MREVMEEKYVIKCMSKEVEEDIVIEYVFKNFQ